MANISDIIRAYTADEHQPYSVLAKVTAVDKTNNTIDCEPLDDSAELLEVRLQAQTGKGLVLYPVVGSDVVVSFFSKDDAFVAMVSQVESVALESQNESLFQLLSDLVDEVSSLRVTTNQGPSIEVINKPAILAIKSRLKNLFSK
ncbi:hypothetical protein E4631_24025 [Hymenobacter sp. UV11]|uniref:hypothetical protein n=1 Tax=Hymenobacter sp. UV11 TaxID=1849735 RepID=UPI0010622CA7|nr:hypothetical protein [Hymenobacter sp. UV11]TDN38613.1 hypothetical protein A8B98_22980 [Hymenobacter sp. UV11]TFZ62999.1 hypothetical protein E4631_24025 [Hymenobacter sp. UV11]